MKKRFLASVFLLITSILLVSCSSPKKVSQERAPLEGRNWPKNINYSANKIDFANAKTLGSLGKKWKKSNEVISIAHFGDSHIQPGWQVGPLRDTFQAIAGDAGRGMVFPYAVAKTYSQEDYSSTFTGKWRTANSIHQPPKIGLGISGFVAKTTDPFTQVSFKFKKNVAYGKVNAAILFRAVEDNYTLTLISGSYKQTINVNADSRSQVVNIALPALSQQLTLVIQAQNGGGEFELHGISLTNPTNHGVVYHNLGVGGAAYNALLQQKLFEQQFPLIQADLVILDWGTNNVIYTNQLAPDLESTIRQTVRKVKQAAPNAAILLTSVQEAVYKGRNVTISEQYAQLIKRIAKEEGVLFYDWYAVSGKHNSVNIWRSLGFASKDGIHLNGKGYRIRAKLLGDALLQAVETQR